MGRVSSNSRWTWCASMIRPIDFALLREEIAVRLEKAS
jgi:hypothetical protein